MRIVRVETAPERMPEVRALFEAYQRELGIDLCFQGFAAELDGLPGKYGPPGGCVLLAESEAGLAGCGALWPQAPGVAELKRLYVTPAFRGTGLGRRLTETLLEVARELRYTRVRLDTLRRLGPALRLYESMGFSPIAPYNPNPEPDIVYLERPLG